MRDFADWLSLHPASESIRFTEWAIPALQTVHILAVAVLLSSVAMLGLRVGYVTGRTETMARTARRFVPWIWTGLAVLATSGFLLVMGEPQRELLNWIFWAKMALILIGVLGTIWFQTALHRNIARWEAGPATRRGTVVAAALTFLLWCLIAVAGRWIAYIDRIPLDIRI